MQHVLITYCILKSIYFAGIAFICDTGAIKLSDMAKFQHLLQNRGLKIALGKDRLFNTNELHKEAKLEKLKWRRKQHLGQLMFHANKQKSFQNWVKRKHAMKTRSSKKNTDKNAQQ